MNVQPVSLARRLVRVALFISCWGASSLGCASAQGSCRAAPPAAAVEQGRSGPVLFVLSAAGELTLANGKTRATGFFLNEFYEAYRALRQAGYEVAIATPEGRPPVVDPESLKPDYWKEHPEWLDEARALVATEASLQRPLRLAEVLADEHTFAALVVPGGQGVMVDLLDNPELHQLLLRFGETHRPVGLICHAPALLANLDSQRSPFQGRRVTSVSGAEEFFIETFIMGGRAKRRDIGGQLDALGFEHDTAFPGRPFAVRDCNLVTSQNPYSGGRFNEAYLAALESWRGGAQCQCAAGDSAR